MSRASEDTLAALHDHVARKLIEKVLSGEATAAEMANAIRFLKDNGIEARADPGSALGALVDALPDFPDPEHEGLPN